MNLFIEGARGLGKSSITRKLRANRMERILMNHTGLNADSVVTKEKMVEYYKALNTFLANIPENSFTTIHDRCSFSEAVMCKVYKTTYTFDEEYFSLVKELDEKTKVQNIHVLLINKNENELERNLSDNSRSTKALLFERDDIQETVQNTLVQQENYITLFNQVAQKNYTNSIFVLLDVEGKSIDSIVDELEGLLTTTGKYCTPTDS